MQTILLNALLCLVIIWLILLIRYTYYIQSSRRYEQEPRSQEAAGNRDSEEQVQAGAHTLVGKSKGLCSRDFPQVPIISSAETRDEKTNTFARQTPEKELEDEEPIDDEDNEMDVAYTTDEVDEDEIIQEELLLDVSPQPEVSPSAILARDLVRMARWAKNDDELDEEDEAEVEATLSQIQGTDLMEKYKEHLKAEEGKHSKLLAVVRKAEEARMKAEATTSVTEESEPTAVNDKPLDYYL